MRFPRRVKKDTGKAFPHGSPGGCPKGAQFIEGGCAGNVLVPSGNTGSQRVRIRCRGLTVSSHGETHDVYISPLSGARKMRMPFGHTILTTLGNSIPRGRQKYNARASLGRGWELHGARRRTLVQRIPAGWWWSRRGSAQGPRVGWGGLQQSCGNRRGTGTRRPHVCAGGLVALCREPR